MRAGVSVTTCTPERGDPEAHSPRAARLGAGLAGTLGTTGIVLVCTFVTNVTTARCLGPADRGIYALIWAVAALAAAGFSFGIPTFTSASTNATSYSRRGVIRNGWQMALASSALLLVSSLVVTFAGVGNFRGFELWHATAVAVIAAAGVLSSHMQSVLVGAGAIRAFNLSRLAPPAAQAAFLVASACCGVFSLRLALASALFCLLATCACAAPALRAITAAAPPDLGPRVAVASLAYGLPAVGSQLLVNLYQRCDTYMLGLLATSAAVGQYSVAMTLAALVWQLPVALNNVMVSELSALPPEPATKTAAEAVRLTFLAACAFAPISAAASLLLIHLIYGHAYFPAALAALILMPGTCFFTIAQVVMVYFLVVLRKPSVNTALSALTLALAAAFNALFIPRWGINGAALASSLTYTISAAVAVLVFCRASRLPIGRCLLPSRADARLLARLAAAAKSRLLRRRTWAPDPAAL